VKLSFILGFGLPDSVRITFSAFCDLYGYRVPRCENKFSRNPLICVRIASGCVFVTFLHIPHVVLWCIVLCPTGGQCLIVDSLVDETPGTCQAIMVACGRDSSFRKFARHSSATSNIISLMEHPANPYGILDDRFFDVVGKMTGCMCFTTGFDSKDVVAIMQLFPHGQALVQIGPLNFRLHLKPWRRTGFGSKKQDQ
jgi:hypothetical protein